MDPKLKSIVEKYSLKETDGFEGKGKTKETNVEEDLRKNYETGKMVPYQSVIAEGKIVGNSKIKLTEVFPSKETEEGRVYNMLFSQSFSDWYEGEFMDHINGENGPPTEEEVQEILEKIKTFLRR